jgi:hypothetical protein
LGVSAASHHRQAQPVADCRLPSSPWPASNSPGLGVSAVCGSSGPLGLGGIWNLWRRPPVLLMVKKRKGRDCRGRSAARPPRRTTVLTGPSQIRYIASAAPDATSPLALSKICSFLRSISSIALFHISVFRFFLQLVISFFCIRFMFISAPFLGSSCLFFRCSPSWCSVTSRWWCTTAGEN